MIRLWKGYHSPSLFELIRASWVSSDLLILCPPLLKEFSFIPCLPSTANHAEPLQWEGDWELTAEQKLEIEKSRLTHRQAAYPSWPDEPVLGVFTSGTVSGNPRLVIYSKKNVESSLSAVLSLFDRTRIDTVFCYPQPFHTFGLLLGYLLSYLNGYRLESGLGRYGAHFHERWLNLNQPKLITLATPTHLLDLAQYIENHPGCAPVLPTYSCILGGAPVSVALWQMVRNRLRIAEPTIGYGATEASPGITHHPPGRVPVEDSEIGFPLPSLQVQIQDNGALSIQGTSVCLAIIQKGQLDFPTRVVIQDRVKQRDDGMLIYQGRQDLTLNRGGEKISLEEIEHKLKSQLEIDVLCFAVKDGRLGQDLAMLVRGHHLEKQVEKQIEKQKITTFLEQAFGIHFKLELYVNVEEFPLNSSYKIDRKRAREHFPQGTPLL